MGEKMEKYIPYILVAIICFGVFGTIYFLIYALHKDEFETSEHLNKVLKTKEQKKIKQNIQHSKNKSLIAILFKNEKGKEFERKMSGALYSAGIELRTEEFFSLILILGIVIPLFFAILQVNVLTCIAISIVGLATPILFLKFKKQSITNKFNSQLAPAMDIMCSSLRAGFPIQTAIASISEEMPDPISREFRYAIKECKLGITLDDALKHVSERMDSEDMSLLVNAISIQREVGGNLASVLDTISETVRNRIKVQENIKTLTTQGTLSGYVVGAMPILLMLGIMIMSPGYMDPLLQTDIGHMILAAAAAMEIIGFIIIKKIVKINF